jgi:hypothetical protein
LNDLVASKYNSSPSTPNEERKIKNNNLIDYWSFSLYVFLPEKHFGQ